MKEELEKLNKWLDDELEKIKTPGKKLTLDNGSNEKYKKIEVEYKRKRKEIEEKYNNIS